MPSKPIDPPTPNPKEPCSAFSTILRFSSDDLMRWGARGSGGRIERIGQLAISCTARRRRLPVGFGQNTKLGPPLASALVLVVQS